MDRYKKLTILHSNDMHGDFLPSDKEGKETGGLARLSGYISKVRAEEKNVIYAVAGDMFRGSVIDSEYHGLSTIDLMNNLRPDVATIGNHEVDYGIGHLLFLEKCAKFPIINADLYVTMNNSRMFRPYINLKVDGMRILVIGMLTREVLASTKRESIIGSYIDIHNSAKEVGKICDNYRTMNTDLTILLTHIGIENDIKLANELKPEWGVDLIIGGHSHTFMDEPVVVNGIPIVHAGTGTEIVGRMDLTVDTEEKTIADYHWECVPVDEDAAPNDKIMEELVDSYRTQTDTKYKRVVTRLARTLTHPSREEETELGNLYADAIQDDSSVDIMMVGSGSIRKKECGPIVEYQDLLELTPFDDSIWMFAVTGEQWRRMIRHILRDEAWVGESEFYQFSKGVKIKYNKTTKELLELKYNGEDVTNDMMFKVAILEFHYKNFDRFLGVPLEEVKQNLKPRMIASSFHNIVEEYFSTHTGLDARVEGRIEVVE